MNKSVLSAHDLAHFAAQGFVRVTNALPKPLVAQTQKVIWEQLHARYGFAQHDPTTWRSDRCVINKKIVDDAVGIKFAPRLRTAIDQLLGVAQWRMAKTLGGLLLTMPEPEGTPWNRAQDWHFDNHPRAYVGRVDELMIFTFFSSVRPRGGGTLALSGSPRLVERYLAASADGRVPDDLPKIDGLAAWHPWLGKVMQTPPHEACSTAALMEKPVEVEGIPLQIQELTGEPGDAVLCHPALLHAVSMNCAAIPRFMRRTNIRRQR